jgi:ABC-type Fe3+-siderophore transport system permease subunit
VVALIEVAVRGTARVGLGGSIGHDPGIETTGLRLLLLLLVAIGTAVSNALSGGIQKLG